MGGFGGLITRGLEAVGEKIARTPAVEEKVDAVIGSATQRIMSMRSNLSTTKGGKAISELLDKHVEPLAQKYMQQESGAAKSYFTQGKNVQGPMLPDWQLKVKAKNQARVAVLGNKDQVASGLISHIEKNDGHEKAQYAVDALGVYFSEEPTPNVMRTPSGNIKAAGSSSSNLVRNLAKNKATQDLFFTNSPYKSPGGPKGTLERVLSGSTSAALAPKSAIIHLSQQLNLPLDQGVVSYLKALKEVLPVIGDYKQAKATIEHAGVAGILTHDEYSAIYRRRYGAASYLPSGLIGDWAAKNFNIPFMPAIKEFNMIVAGMQGKIKAAEIADTLQKGGTMAQRAATSDARRLGLDPQKLGSGQLTKDDIETAMYNHINNTIFFNSRQNRSIYALKSTSGRLISMYHNFALQQSNLIYNNLKRTIIEKHDPVSVIRTMALFGIVAPAVGEGIEEFRRLATGRDWDDPTGHYTDRMEDFYSNKDWDLKLQAMAHIAGYGYIIPYIRAAGRHKLAQAMTGPIGGEYFEGGEDLYHGIVTKSKGDDSREWYPFMRDVLHDTPSMGIGAIASNYFLPPQDPHASRGGRSNRRPARRR